METKKMEMGIKIHLLLTIIFIQILIIIYIVMKIASLIQKQKKKVLKIIIQAKKGSLL